MKRISIILIALLCVFDAIAQKTSIIDSLKIALEKHTDSTKAKIAFEIAKFHYYYNTSTDSITHYADLGLEYSREYDFSEGEDRYHFLMGQMQWQNKDYGAALHSFQICEKLLEARGDQRALAMVHNAYGTVYMSFEDYEKANEHYIKTLKIGEELGLKNDLATTYSNLAIVNTRGRHFRRSLRYNKKALAVLADDLSEKDSLILVTTLLNTAASYKNLNLIDTSRLYSRQAIDLAKKMKYDKGIQRALYSRLMIELESKNYEAVLIYADSLQSWLNRSPPTKHNCSLINGVPYYKSLAYHYLDKHQQAIEYAHLTQEDARECGISVEYNALHALVLAYKGAGQYLTAFEYQDQYNDIEDSIINTGNNVKIQALQSLYESEKRERELAELSQQTIMQTFQIRKRNLLILGISSIALLALFLLYLFSQQRIIKNQGIASNAEQRLLRLQMNPHFLFNALSSIQTFLFDKKDATKAVHYLSRFAELMRQILEYSRETYITLEDEIRTLENYLSLQQLRHNHEFDYKIEVEEGLNRWETMIPPLMAQPFVENAIEHGKVYSVEDGKIRIRFLSEGNHLKLLVEDNGIGREQALQLNSKKKYKSLATSITKDRVQLLSQIAKQKFSFEVKDLPERGTQVIFQFPLN